MSAAAEEARLRMEVAKIDLIVATYRRDLQDERLSMEDVAAIMKTAAVFAVTERAAYLRARELGVLSYQDDGR